jgi:hypothetical protein
VGGRDERDSELCLGFGGRQREEEQERTGARGEVCNCKDEVGENSLSFFF